MLERVLIVLSGTTSLWLGWNLFCAGILKKQEAEIKAGGAVIKFRDVGPGTFFAFFGAAILIVALSKAFVFETKPVAATPGGAGTQQQVVSWNFGLPPESTHDMLKAINTLKDAEESGAFRERGDVTKAVRQLREYRVKLLGQLHPRYEEYRTAAAAARANPPDLQPAIRFGKPAYDEIAHDEQDVFDR